MTRGAVAFDRALQVIAALASVGVFCTAALDVSYAWDVWYYHLPFAARIVGIVPSESFVFHAANQARFEGLPLLCEALQGLFWRVTGRVESTNLVAFGAIPLFAWFLRRRLNVPWSSSVLGLLAIPLVQAHASSSYVDLPGNVALAVVVLLAVERFATDRPVDAPTLVLGGAAAAIAANTKLLLAPLALGAWLVLVFGAARPAWARRAVPWRLGAFAFGICVLVLAWPLKNLLLHHNPTFPVRMTLFGHAFPGAEDPYSSSPRWLAGAPEPFRFACSILEVGVRPMTDAWRWTVDQYMPPDSSGPRMGGFFGAYVAAEICLFAARAYAGRERAVRRAATAFAAFTVVTSFMPQAHELRYYMSWMIVLVATNRWLAYRSGAAWPRVFGGVSFAAFAVVVAVSHGVYVTPFGSTFSDLVREKVDSAKVDAIRDGERVCVEKAPFNLLGPPRFIPLADTSSRRRRSPPSAPGTG